MGAFKDNKEEILYNALDCLLVGFIAFLTAVVSVGQLTQRVFFASFMAALLAASIKFKEYWTTQKVEFTTRTLGFF